MNNMVTKVKKTKKIPTSEEIALKVIEQLNTPGSMWTGVSKVEVIDRDEYYEISYLTQEGSMSKWRTITIKK